MDKCTVVEKYRGDGDDVPPASSLSRPPARLAGKEDDGLLGSGQSDLDEEPPPPGRDTQDEDMPPWSLSVTFEKLADYEPELLLVDENYFPRDKDEMGDAWPLALTVMLVGIDGIPSNLQDLEVVDRVTRDNKAKLFNKSRVLNNTRSAVKQLKKELVRRVKSSGKPAPRVRTITLDNLLKKLRETPPEESEIRVIKSLWNELLEIMQDHYLEQSGSADALLWRDVRFIELLLHPSRRDSFKTRNNQVSVHVLDGRNSPLAPLSFGEELAGSYNSSIVVESVDCSSSLGAPFDKIVKTTQPSQKNRMTGADAHKKILTLRGFVLLVKEGMFASGMGQGAHQGDTVMDLVTSHKGKGKNAKALSPIAAYAYQRIVNDEDLLVELTQVNTEDLSAGMSKTPRIVARRKRGGVSNSSMSGLTASTDPKRSRSAASHDPTYDLLNRISIEMTSEGMHNRITDLRSQLLGEQALKSEQEKAVSNLRRELRLHKKDLRDAAKASGDSLPSKEDIEQDSDYAAIDEELHDRIDDVNKTQQKIEAYEEELVKAERKYREFNKPAKPAAESSDEEDETEEGKGSEERGNSVEDGAEMLDDGDEEDDIDRIIDGGVKFPGMEDIEVRSNDGSRDLRDDEISLDEQIEEEGDYEC